MTVMETFYNIRWFKEKNEEENFCHHSRDGEQALTFRSAVLKKKYRMIII